MPNVDVSGRSVLQFLQKGCMSLRDREFDCGSHQRASMIQSVGTLFGALYRADPRGVGVGARLKLRTVNSDGLLKTPLWI